MRDGPARWKPKGRYQGKKALRVFPGSPRFRRRRRVAESGKIEGDQASEAVQPFHEGIKRGPVGSPSMQEEKGHTPADFYDAQVLGVTAGGHRDGFRRQHAGIL